MRRGCALVLATLALAALTVLGPGGPAVADLGYAGNRAPQENHGGAPWLALPDGRALTAGGHAGAPGTWPGDLTDVTEIYDPRTHSWTIAAPMVGGRRQGHAGTVLADGSVLMAGGAVRRDGPATDWSAIYHPEADAWRETGPLPGAGVVRLLALPDGRALAAGRVGAVFDPRTETWAPLRFPRGYLGRDPLVLPDGRILATTAPGAAEFARFLYDPDTNSRSVLGGGPRHWMPSALLPDGRVMLASGSKTRFLDPARRTWSSGAGLNQPGSELVALDSGRVLLRQRGGQGAVSRAWSYDVGSDGWREEPGSDVSRMIALRGGRLLGAFAGAHGPIGEGWRFDPRSTEYADGAPSPPVDVTVGYARGTLSVEWRAPRRRGWSPVSGYRLEFLGGLLPAVDLPPEGRAFSVPLPVSTRVVRVRLSAVNGRAASRPAHARTTLAQHSCTLLGTDGPDLLVGTSGDDVICGLGGDDIIDGAAGGDVLLGGSGVDTLRFLDATGPVTVDQAAGSARGLGQDVIGEFEDIRGTRFDDVLAGGDALSLRGLDGDDRLGGADRLLGGAGDDHFLLAQLDGGARLLDGGRGIDTADYTRRPSWLWMDLLTGELAAGDGILGEVREVENVVGSQGHNRLLGDDGRNVIVARRGEVYGRAGDDLLTAGDFVDGGDGVDRCRTIATTVRRRCER